jgi:hypothetical protein
LIDVACQRLDSNPYGECLLYGRRTAYIYRGEYQERNRQREAEKQRSRGEKSQRIIPGEFSQRKKKRIPGRME